MAADDWEIIYEGMTPEERAEELTTLKAELKNFYLAQSQGGKSYQRSITDVRMRMAALTRVNNAAAGKYKKDYTVADFS